VILNLIKVLVIWDMKLAQMDGHDQIHSILLFNNQPDTLIIQIYSVIKLYMFRASYLPFIGSFLLYIQHW